MKVRELIELLQTVDSEAEVLGASDSEGNSFSPLESVSIDMVYREYQREYEIGYSKLTSDLKKRGYSEEDLLEGGKRCVVIWP